MIERPRYLILGGTGFVGRAVVRAIEREGVAEAIVASRHASPSTPRQLRLDVVGNPDALKAAVEGVHGVVNCITGSDAIIEQGARNLAEAVRGKQLPVVHLSSMAAYGSVHGLVAEDAPLKGDLGGYSQAKASAERRLSDLVQRLVILRPGVIYGPGSVQWTQRVGRWLASGRLGDLGRAGDGICNLVHIDDTVRIIVAALRDERIQNGCAFNLALPSPPTWNEYFIEFGRALRAVPVKRLTTRRMRWEAKMAYPRKAAEMICKRLGITIDLDAMGPSYWALWQQDIRLDVTRATETFGPGWADWRKALRELSPALANPN